MNTRQYVLGALAALSLVAVAPAIARLRAASSAPAFPTRTVVAHLPVPGEVRGLYWNAVTAGSASIKKIAATAIKNGINAVVIDVKLDNGALAFMPRDPLLRQFVALPATIGDLDGLLRFLEESGVYRIARIAVARDGRLAKINPRVALTDAHGFLWRDRIGSVWVDPAASDVAAYALALGREAFARGFDEIQYDYIRYPSDGKTAAIIYPVSKSGDDKTAVIASFFEKVGGTLRAEGIPVSIDLFGMTFWSVKDFGIGQRAKDALRFADYLSPMTYPSHYPPGFEGYLNPATHPYEIVKKTLESGAALLGDAARPQFRPWIQDFDLGASYGAREVKAQIKAARDSGASGWMLWNARNVYTDMTYD